MSDAHSNPSKTDVNVLRERIVALQKSASNLVQMDLNELSAMLPPDTSRERLIEIRAKLLQLHRLQNSRNDGQSESENVNSSADGVTNRSSRYKTELCRPFEENGVCKYGARCQFAHGVAELRNLARHPKYKSQLCRTFHSNGLCPYGHRCHFIHNQDEIRGGASSKLLGMQANPNYTDVNMNNAQRNDAYAELVCNEWGRRANFSNSSSDTFRKLPPSSLMQSLMPRPRPALEMPIPPAMPVPNGFKPLSTGCSLGSAGELSPPVSPIVYSPEDPFSSQTAIRHGYFASGVLGESSEFKLNQMLAFTKFPGSLSGPCTQTSAPSFGRASQSPENPQPISAQVVPPHLWWNGEGL